MTQITRRPAEGRLRPPRRWRLRVCLLLVPGILLVGDAARLHAQGVTTVSIRGTVAMADGGDPEGARVEVRSTATGFVLATEVRRGRFLIQGLEPGGPYTITVRRIGALARRWDGVILQLGEPLELHVLLEPAAVALDSVVVVAEHPFPLPCCHGGTATTLSDSLIHRLPSLNRNVYDFLRLVPQLSTRVGLSPGGISAGGAGFRQNSFLTNGVSERSLAGGQPPEFAGGKSLPFEAVREYQVLVAPFDVRYGDFTGALINTITRSGTNRLQGSAFVSGRNDGLARGGDVGALPYDRWQFGTSVSGAIVPDRFHFLLAAEFQRLNAPMVGPFVGQPAGAASAVPVGETDLARLETIMAGYGLESGSGRALANRNRILGVFGRLDAALPRWNSRAVLWVNDSDTRNRAFARGATTDSFALTSYSADQVFPTRTMAVQLSTALPRRGGGHNELSLSRRTIDFDGVPAGRQPVVRVGIPAIPAGITTVVTGSAPQAQGGAQRTRDLILRDDLSLPLGVSHVASVGVEAEWFRIVPDTGLPNDYGTWTFDSLGALAAGQAASYVLNVDFGSADVPLRGGQFAAYAGDHWQIGERVALTLGLRADLLSLSGPAPYNPTVDSLFDRRTDRRFGRRVRLSPRIGFTWDPRGTGRDQVRGGLGIFTGRPPLAWLHLPLQSYGDGVGTVRCGSRPGDLGPPPGFDPDPLNPPQRCAGDEGLSGPPPGPVELLAPDLGMARTLRGALAYERRLPGGLVGTVEGLVTRGLADFAFVNLNLVGPQGTDARGRVMYGTHDVTGQATPVRVSNALPSVIELRNVSGSYGVQVSGSVSRQFEGGLAAMASYTWSRARDVQTPLRVNLPGNVNWASRAVSGRHDDLTPGISLNDVPHRLVFAGTWRAPWKRWLTEISVLYVGESGGPFTFRAGGAARRGDLNADGELNDPIYVPRDAFDPDEIVFTGAVTQGPDSPEMQGLRVARQRAAFERFIRSTPCLRRQRGRILARNSCREPWTHTTAASVRQVIPVGSQALEAQLDVFNLLNLLDGEWGLRRQANPVALELVGVVPTDPGRQEPVYRFAQSAASWTIDRAESSFQVQFGMRYRF